MLSGAIIGIGNIAIKGHIPAYLGDDTVRSEIQITSVVDVVKENREQAARHFPGARIYSDVTSLLRHERIDFVDICSPPHTHSEYIKACGARGIHIICEKPFTNSLQSAVALIPFFQNQKFVFVPCHQYKYSPLWKSIHGVIESGTIGKISLAQFNVFRLQADTGSAGWSPEWRISKRQSGGGILFDTGAHYFYLAQYFFGVPEKVSAVLRNLKHLNYEVEDTAVVTLDFNGTLMQINLTWAAGQRANNVFIAGTEGSLSYDGSKLYLSTAGEVKELPMPNVSDKSQYIEWYASLFKEFLRRIKINNFSDDLFIESLNVMKLLDASYSSSSENSVIGIV